VLLVPEKVLANYAEVEAGLQQLLTRACWSLPSTGTIIETEISTKHYSATSTLYVQNQSYQIINHHQQQNENNNNQQNE